MQPAPEMMPILTPEQALAELTRLGYKVPSEMTLEGAVRLPEGLRFVFGPGTLCRDEWELHTLCGRLEEPERPDPLSDPELAALAGGQPYYKLLWMRSKGLIRSGPNR